MESADLSVGTTQNIHLIKYESVLVQIDNSVLSGYVRVSLRGLNPLMLKMLLSHPGEHKTPADAPST